MNCLPELLRTVIWGNTSSRLLWPALERAQITLQENVLGHVIGRAHAVDRIGAEILDAQGAEIGAEFEVLGLDLRGLHFAAVDLRLDDRGFPLRLIGNDRRRRLLAAMEPAAAGQQRRR